MIGTTSPSAIAPPINPLSGKWRWRYQKNRHYLEALLFRRVPEFVYRRKLTTLPPDLPVFTFHKPDPHRFERQCRFLAENRYQTLGAEQVEAVLRGRGALPRKAVVLTFDDGLKEVWTTAFPLLRQYGLRAICFLVPGCMPEEDDRVRPVLGQEPPEAKETAGLLQESNPLVTWAEAERMQNSGTVDFQSHTMYHSLVFIGPQIVDFINPGYPASPFGNISVPFYASGGQDRREPQPGLPIYRSAPRLAAEHRYFDVEEIRQRCTEMVQQEGGADFFSQPSWRRRLLALARRQQGGGRFESAAERDREVTRELVQAREIINRKLGSKVVHLCFPWYGAAELGVRAAKRAGYLFCYYGTMATNSIARQGGLAAVPRLEEVFLERLPGKGRRSISALFRSPAPSLPGTP